MTFDTTRVPDGTRRVRVFLEDASGNRALVAGPLTRTIDNVPPPSNPRRPSITGSARSGSGLVADEGGWSGTGLVYAYSWQRCEADGATCTDIPGAWERTYLLSGADAGKRVRVRVRATNGEGSADAYSEATGAVAASAQDGATVGRGDEGGERLLPQPVRAPNGEHATHLATLTAHESGTDRRTIRVRFGRRVVVSGRLLAPGGVPITGARLEVVSRDRASGAPLVPLAPATTDAAGAYRYVVAPGASRVVRIGYRARIGDISYARTTEVNLRVIAKLSFRLSRSKLRNRQTLRYLGRVQGPRTGHRFAEVQVRNGKRWIVVCSVRTDARGSFGCAHRFTRTFKRTRYRFRARVRRQTGLPYEPSASASRWITVRP